MLGVLQGAMFLSIGLLGSAGIINWHKPFTTPAASFQVAGRCSSDAGSDMAGGGTYNRCFP
jgi:hypothetical protein